MGFTPFSTLAAVLLTVPAPTDQSQASRCPNPLPSAVAAKEALLRAGATREPQAIAAQITLLECVHANSPPERPERYLPRLLEQPQLTVRERDAAIERMWRRAQPSLWWERKSAMPQPLRVPAEAIQASLSSWRMSGQAAEHLARARRAGDYLLQVQADSGSGVFGFPLNADLNSPNGRLAERFIAEVKRRKVLDQVTRGGWIIDDLSEGDLNYDNGLAGQALIALGEATGDARYIDAAVRAGEWATRRPIVANFNYNGFSAALLADLFRITGDRKWLDTAAELVIHGVLSGQWRHGPEGGSWIDPHNKRLVYRYIMIGQMADVLRAMPADDPRGAAIRDGLEKAISAAESQQSAAGGIGNLNSAIVALCKVRASVGTRATRTAIQIQYIEFIRSVARQANTERRLESGPGALACGLEVLEPN